MTTSVSLAPGRATWIRRLLPGTGAQAAISGLVLVAVLAPVVPLVYASVQSAPIYQPGRYFTVAAYRQLFTDPAFWAAARNTAEFAAITTAGALVLGGGFAIVCGRTDVPGRRWYPGLLIAPLVLPPLGLILGWNAGPPVVSAGATVLLGCACVLLLLRGALLRDQARFVTIGGRRGPVGGGGGTGSVGLPAAARLALTALLGLYVAVTTFAPIAALGLSSVTTELTPLIAPWHLLTAGNWRAIGQGEFADSIRNTVEIALAGALITTAVVALATAVAHRSAFPLRRGLPFLLLFPRAVPGLILGIGFFWTFLLINPPGHALLDSLWGIMLALSVRSLTIAYFVLSAAFAAVSESLDNAARSAGASWWAAITRITLPILRPALFAALILMFISILNDYDPALFLETPGHELMGVTMLLSEQQGTNGPVAALAMVQVAITVVAIAVAGRLFSTRLRGRPNA